MMGRTLDWIVGQFSPQRGLRRMQARQTMEWLQKRSASRDYAGASSNRLNSDWVPVSRTPDSEITLGLSMLRARSRDLVRNNPHAAGALQAICANVVGTGITPQARSKSNEWNESLEELFKRWAEFCDLSGRSHFFELQELVLRQVMETGECLLKKVSRKAERSSPFSYSLQLLEPDYLVTSQDRVGSGKENPIRNGIEIDSVTGRPVAYYIQKDFVSATGTMSFSGSYERVPSEEIIHVFRPLRPGQTRGIPWLAPVLMMFRDLGEYLDAEVVGARLAACYMAFITKQDPYGAISSETEQGEGDDSDKRLQYFEPGIIEYLSPGDTITLANPNRPGETFTPFVQLMLRSIAVGLGISYEILARDYTKTNFSSARQSHLEDRRQFRPMQQMLVYQFLQPVWNDLVNQAVLAKKVKKPADYWQDPYSWRRCDWITPGWEWIDPLKEVQAEVMAIENNLKTRAETINARGGDFESVVAGLASENESLEAAGLAPYGPAAEKADMNDE